MPRAAEAVWQAFLQLSASRRTGMGAHALVLADVEAWCRLGGVRLTPWELDVLIELDAAQLAAIAKQST